MVRRTAEALQRDRGTLCRGREPALRHSRDIPMQTMQMSQDRQVIPNYVPEKQKQVDYVQEQANIQNIIHHHQVEAEEKKNSRELQNTIGRLQKDHESRMKGKKFILSPRGQQESKGMIKQV